MESMCNQCDKIIKEHDVTIHYTKSSNGLDIVAVCQQCLEKHMEKTIGNVHRKEDENERMKRKW
jgi:hypothetical protein